MSIPEALGQGFVSFYSIWQVCIFQITPFFLAFITGLYFVHYRDRAGRSLLGWLFLPAALFTIGFCTFYALSSVTGLPVGRFLSYNGGTLGFLSGVFILLVALSLLLAGRTVAVPRSVRFGITGGGSLLLGVAFALVYSPCVTPTLSEILGLTTRPETAVRGGVLAFFYALGISIALGLTGAALIWLLGRIPAAVRHPGRVRDVAGGVLGILGLLNVFGFMVHYKAYMLGLLVACLAL
jgi:cytochrome c-type biogenesis protein